MRRIFLALTAIALFLPLGLNAQNGTNSPYSQYGYGRMADQVNGPSKGMAGLSLGLRQGNAVNINNPASYSSVDSLSFLFDAGITLQITNFQEEQHKLNARNTSLDYVAGSFRLWKHYGFAFGMMPYSNVGYDYYNSGDINEPSPTGSDNTTYTNTYYGDGGFHQVFVGFGGEILRIKSTKLSIGTNISYFWGNYSKMIVNSYSDDYVNTLSKSYDCSVKALKIDFGLQFTQGLGHNDDITIGAVFSPKWKLYGNPECSIISTNSQTYVADTTSLVANGVHYTPASYGIGVVYNHANKIKVGFDYKTELWKNIKYPMYSVVDDQPQYTMEEGLFKNRQKFIFGGEFCANPMARNWFKRVRIRAGFSYSTPYLLINGENGPKEIGVSLGFGLPITNAYNNRSTINISAQWNRQSAQNFIKENIFSINIGFTFNERWFAKWQLE